MDMTVGHLGGMVVAVLRASGYAELTIGQYEKTIKALRLFVAGRGGVYTKTLGAQFAASTISEKTGRVSAARRFSYTRLVSVFDILVDTGEVVLATRKRGGGGPRPVSTEFVALDAAWEVDMRERGLAAATREAYGRVARSFLSYLEQCSVTRLDQVRPDMVAGFLVSLLDRWASTSLFWVVSNFRPFLVFTSRRDLVEAVNQARIRRPHMVMAVMGDEDVRRVVDVCATPGMVTARDAAVTLLALLTGLRACDIAALRLGDIEWRSQTLTVIQQKTKNPVTLPLPDLVVARLAEYVHNERPHTGDDHVFLRQIAPFLPLFDHSTVHRITTVVFRKAGVVQPNAGTRLLRHTAATRLLRAATPLSTISAVLGHARVESTRVYLSVDDERLVGCVLPVPAGAFS